MHQDLKQEIGHIDQLIQSTKTRNCLINIEKHEMTNNLPFSDMNFLIAVYPSGQVWWLSLKNSESVTILPGRQSTYAYAQWAESIPTKNNTQVSYITKIYYPQISYCIQTISKFRWSQPDFSIFCVFITRVWAVLFSTISPFRTVSISNFLKLIHPSWKLKFF